MKKIFIVLLMLGFIVPYCFAQTPSAVTTNTITNVNSAANAAEQTKVVKGKKVTSKKKHKNKKGHITSNSATKTKN